MGELVSITKKNDKELIDLFKHYSECFKEGDSIAQDKISDEVFTTVKDAVTQYWLESTESLNDVVDLYIIISLIESDSPKHKKIVTRFFNDCKMFLTAKEKKQGKRGRIDRLLKEYSKPQTKERLQKSLKVAGEIEIAQLQAAYDQTDNHQKKIEDVQEVIEKYGMHFTIFITTYIETQGADDMHDLYLEAAPFRYVNILSELALFHTEKYPSQDKVEEILFKEERNKFQSKLNEYEKKFHKQEKLLNKYKLENEHLKKQIISSDAKASRVVKQTERSVNELMSDLATEEEIKSEQHKNEVEYLNKMIEQMAQEIIQLQKEEEPEGNVHKNDLSGRKVAVIGGNKERYYRECVEKYNAEIIFVAEDQHRKIDSAVKKADVVFYLTELLSHIYHELIIPAAARYNTPVRFVNSKGITSFENAVKRYTED
ncbi:MULTISPECIES: DUF2325 domain-containing protein [Bacillus cereus group]|uniref:DUF2325 domain-containing protein n=1 Tax=Bacillus cereus group TaxID=86661 RepID=UPI001F441FD3|nr:DUF2325 domain-containing protein [Bacillus cereus]MDA1521510.1 DUF2325 domain-containing protein [Bacillus cereus]BCC50590.1 hypothetical protein BCJMU02_p2184 [Bacillus cereus]HDR7981195.1 DUF2325 domain-containing protein [Bacillus cereus]HDR8058491.1 DUF2325 domain-containing protein [Bacillus cereus]HDR8220617.1 DUF2325 domain-containing protein [Bacillus cereus]